MTVAARAYLSPTLVLLALDWKDGQTTPDFLGFAVKRKPGFLSADGQSRESESWLPNHVTFRCYAADSARIVHGSNNMESSCRALGEW
jgi:hypothetical protein